MLAPMRVKIFPNAYKLQGLRALALCPERAAYFEQYVF